MSFRIERHCVVPGQLHHHVDDLLVGGARVEQQAFVNRVLERVVVERRAARLNMAVTRNSETTILMMVFMRLRHCLAVAFAGQ